MQYRELGRTGMQVSILSCGSNALRGYTYDEAKLAYNRALDNGINLIETGRPYGDETEDRVLNRIFDNLFADFLRLAHFLHIV